MSDFLYIPFWRSGKVEANDTLYVTQLYFAPLAEGPVRLGIYLYENGGRPWSRKTFKLELDQHAAEVRTNDDGMLDVQVGAGQMIRVEISVLEHEYGTGEVHLLGGASEALLLARGEVEIYAAEPAGGFEMSTTEITITGATPVVLRP